MEKEIWKPLKNHESKYSISNMGRIKNLDWKGLGIEKNIIPYIASDGYYKIRIGKTMKRVHQLVAINFLNHCPNGIDFVIDHINSNPLDNRVSNLRIVTHRQNCSKEKVVKSGLPVGVTFFKKTNKFLARIQIEGKRKNLGYFNSPLEASKAYQKVLSTLVQKKDDPDRIV